MAWPLLALAIVGAAKALSRGKGTQTSSPNDYGASVRERILAAGKSDRRRRTVPTTPGRMP